MKKGFTLIELLAVIIVLAVIAVVATPIVLNTIDDARTSANKSSVAMFANAVKLRVYEDYFKDQTYPTVDVKWIDDNVVAGGGKVTCEEAFYDAAYGVILHRCSVNGNEVGANFIDDMTVHADTLYCFAKEVVYTDCLDTGYVTQYNAAKSATASTVLDILQDNTQGVNGLYYDNIVYKGANPNNYIEFNGTIWRIVSIGSDNSIKIIGDSIASKQYGACGSWVSSTPMATLNTWYNALSASVKANVKENATWYSGPYDSNTILVKTSTSSANIGTIDNEEMKQSALDRTNYLQNNWLLIAASYWSMNPPYTTTYNLASLITTSGINMNNGNVTNWAGVRPVVNLKPETLLTGSGTSADPFKINVSGKTVTNVIKASIGSANGLYYQQNYYKGATPNNYIKFNNEVWRILSYESNGTIKIMGNSIKTGVYGPNHEWGTSTALTDLNNWYTALNANSKQYIVSYNKWRSSKVDTRQTLLDSYTTGYVGLLDYLEFNKYGAYLNKGISYWLMTATLDSVDTRYVIIANSLGTTANSSYNVASNNIIPVVYLRSDILLTGLGTVDSPYEIMLAQ